MNKDGREGEGSSEGHADDYLSLIESNTYMKRDIISTEICCSMVEIDCESEEELIDELMNIDERELMS